MATQTLPSPKTSEPAGETVEARQLQQPRYGDGSVGTQSLA